MNKSPGHLGAYQVRCVHIDTVDGEGDEGDFGRPNVISHPMGEECHETETVPVYGVYRTNQDGTQSHVEDYKSYNAAINVAERMQAYHREVV